MVWFLLYIISGFVFGSIVVLSNKIKNFLYSSPGNDDFAFFISFLFWPLILSIVIVYSWIFLLADIREKKNK